MHDTGSDEISLLCHQMTTSLDGLQTVTAFYNTIKLHGLSESLESVMINNEILKKLDRSSTETLAQGLMSLGKTIIEHIKKILTRIKEKIIEWITGEGRVTTQTKQAKENLKKGITVVKPDGSTMNITFEALSSDEIKMAMENVIELMQVPDAKLAPISELQRIIPVVESAFAHLTDASEKYIATGNKDNFMKVKDEIDICVVTVKKAFGYTEDKPYTDVIKTGHDLVAYVEALEKFAEAEEKATNVFLRMVQDHIDQYYKDMNALETSGIDPMHINLQLKLLESRAQILSHVHYYGRVHLAEDVVRIQKAYTHRFVSIIEGVRREIIKRKLSGE